MLKNGGWGKSREQVITGRWDEGKREKMESIRSSDTGERKKCYKSDDLIASIVSMTWSGENITKNLLCSQFPLFPLSCSQNTHIIHTHKHTRTQSSPGTLLLINSILLPLLFFPHCVTLFFKREFVSYWPLCKFNKELITAQNPLNMAILFKVERSQIY